VRLSQEVHGQTWRYLGEFYFEAGTSGHVSLLDDSVELGQAVVADAVRFGGGLGSIAGPQGTSGEPRWEEEASLWAQYQGAPTAVYTNDVTARPLYAEWETAKGYPGESGNAVYLSWHTNAGGGTGTNSFIHDTDPTPGSAALQDWVHTELVSDLKAAWNPNWVDRGQKSANFGEVRELSTMPGVLLEVAFHDTEDPGDADDLRQPLFRQIAARAVYQGIVKYFADRDSAAVHLLPEPPTRLVARNSGSGQVTLSWAAPTWGDGVVGDAATSYKVYRSPSGRGFDDGTPVSGTSLLVTGLAPGSLHFFRVTALNEGGESFPTPVVAVRTPSTGSASAWLVVDGFERLDESALIPQWESSALGTAQRMFLERMNRYDYAVEHGQALSDCSRAFDGALNEAVVAGDVALGDYAALDWFVGEDAAADSALSTEERALLAAYLEGGGRLLISGSEIGYDLVGNGRDPAFYGNYLRAAYRGDDAGTYDFSGVPGGPFAGLSGRFDDSTQGTYDVGFPDRLGAANGSMVVLSYAGGTGDGAAVAYSGDSRLVHFGFPLETVTDPATRTSLFCAAADYLLPPLAAGVSLTPNQTGVAEPGQTAVYSHTLTNSGHLTDTFHLTHHSSQGWAVSHPLSLTLSTGQTATLVVSITVSPGAGDGAVETTILTATSASEPAIRDTAVDTTTVEFGLVCTPRLIDPGFEGGTGQSAWQVSPISATLVFVQRDDLPPDNPPYSGDWLARLGPVQTVTAGITGTQTLTQVVALPSGEPTATLSLAWLVDAPTLTSTLTDTFSLGVYALSGALQTRLLTLTNESPAGSWHTAEFDLSAFAGETIQVAFRAATSETAFLLDDVQVTTCGRRGPDEFRALWVDAYHDGIKNRQQIDELVETARAGGFNALIVQVRKRGDTYYPSGIDPWAPDADPTFDALAYLIDRAHAAGIEVHAWVATLPIWSAGAPPSAPDHAFNRHGPGTGAPDYWLMTNAVGEEEAGDHTYYLDPGHPDVVEYLVAIFAELASHYDLDGLHLDRVRYPWRSWGYNPVSVARFQALTGKQDVPAPQDPDWLQWRRDQVTALVRRIYLTVGAINPRLRLSAALSALGDAPLNEAGWQDGVPYSRHLQDWRGWLAEGSLDLALPMIYRDQDSYAGQFQLWSEWAKNHQYNRGLVVGTGLYLNDVADSMDQWLDTRRPSALSHSALGLSGYSYATTNDEGLPRREFVNAAVTEVFTRSALVPPLPWRDAPSLGHLMGTLTPTLPCRPSLDGHRLTLTGPQTRTLLTDGSGWFGAVDLVPGVYLISSGVLTTGLTISQPVAIVAGAVAVQPLILPECPAGGHKLYLPLILKGAHR